jgi:hypothetical protein
VEVILGLHVLGRIKSSKFRSMKVINVLREDLG